jgi:parallel beta-helix repeat protein
MQLLSWLHKRMTGRAQTRRSSAPRSTPRFRPQLEALDGRDVPSTLTVTTNRDNIPGSLRNEIAVAHKGDTIVVPAAIGAITTGATITIINDLTIQGPSTGHVLIHGENQQLFNVRPSAHVAFSGFSFQFGGGAADLPFNGLEVGGAFINFGTLTLSNCILSSDKAAQGGAIYNTGTLTLLGCTLSGNSGTGAALYNTGTATISDCTLSNNWCANGGAIYNAATGKITVQHSVFSGNVGFAIDNAASGNNVTVLNSVFSGNTPLNIYGSFTDGGGNTFN